MNSQAENHASKPSTKFFREAIMFFTRWRHVTTRILLFLAVATAGPAIADTANFFGHDVLIAGWQGKHQDQQVLRIDGKQIASADLIFIEESATIGGVNVILASLHASDVFCAPRATLITLVKGKAPVLVTPDADCRATAAEIGKSSVTFTVAPRPIRDGMKVTWTPAAGLGPSETIAFRPDPQKSWANLLASQVESPGDLFSFADIGAQLRDALGRDYAKAIEIIDGTGYGAFKRDAYVGSSCKPHNCDDTGALVVADIPSRRVFVAWKARDEKIVVRPDVAGWPLSARRELRQWAQPWAGNMRADPGETHLNETVLGDMNEPALGPLQTASIIGPQFDELHGIFRGEQAQAFDHNGSSVWIFRRAGLIVYDQPKASIADVVPKGDILFRGEIGSRVARGTAFVFKKGCEPAPYAAQGNGYGDAAGAPIVLRGAAPVRDRHGCAVIGASTGSANAKLVFKVQEVFGDI
jgi:hypothetical protein